MKKHRAPKGAARPRSRGGAGRGGGSRGGGVVAGRGGDADLLPALELLQRRREPYGPAIAAIIADTLERFPPVSDARIVEIGAGTGQLRAWLPPPHRTGTIHTDPSHAALAVLRSRAPEAMVLAASALALPFSDGACGAVLALCVFDAIAERDQAAAARELARVLRPGGRFVHFLDMATLLDAPFRKLADAGMVPIPNVFADPADEEWPLDIYLLKREWLAGLLDFAIRTAHPLAQSFGEFFATFLAAPPAFDVRAATDAFKTLASDGARRAALATFLTSASRLAAQWGHPPVELVAFHSGKYLASVLQTTFASDGAFQVRLCEIRTHATRAVAAPDDTPFYRSLCLGHQRIMDHLPRRLLTSGPLATVPPVPEELSEFAVTIVEAGVLVFVAERR